MSNRMMRVFNPPNNYIMFDGKALSDFGIRVSGAGTYGSPERDVDEQEVPGRDGSIVFDNGRFKNIDIEYEASLLGEDQKDYTRRIEAFRSYMASRKGYKRLEDTYRTGEYRMAQFIDGLDPEEIMLQGSSFKLKFNCKPQRFLKSGERSITYTADNMIYNPTYFDSKPLIRVYGYGTVEVMGYEITIKEHSLDYIDIDSDMMDCYYNTTNCNDLVTLSNNDFPVLVPGINNIALKTGITKIEITPRWWQV